MTRKISSLLTIILAIGVVACQNDSSPYDVEPASAAHAGHLHVETRSSFVGEVFERGENFEQVGLMFTGSRSPSLAWSRDGQNFQPVEITWTEGRRHVARVLLEQPAERIHIRSQTPLGEATFEFYPEKQAEKDLLAREMPFATYESREVLTGIAPRSLVIPRAEWGARNPNKVCGSSHEPYRMSIHHTAGPNGDGDSEARMRQIQAFHIDSRGWCDVGYHFVVSQDGQIYQGRSNEERTGAHVGGQNTGNIGISLMGNFQQFAVPAPQFQATAQMMRWVSDTYNIALDRSVTKGHQEWPGQSTACPGNDVMNRFNELIELAGGDPGNVEDPNTYETPFQVRWISETTDFYQEGSSEGIPDLFPGDTIQAEIVLKNASSTAIRDVELSYWIESPFLSATNYLIETDYPELDGATWMVNDADSAPSNPARDALGPEGKLTMYAFTDGESKRVVVDLTADAYSLGGADHPDLRAWLHNVSNVYGVQEAWNADPTNANLIGEIVQGFAQLDVLSTTEWQFDTGEAEQLEGWSPCRNGVATLAVEPEVGALRLVTNEPAGCTASPAWTDIDAEAWDQIVLRMNGESDGVAALYWASDDGDFTAENRVAWRASAGDATYVVPVGEHEGWTGRITTLWIVPRMESIGTTDIDAVFAQSSAREVTSSARETYGGEVVEPLVENEIPDLGLPGGDRIEDSVVKNSVSTDSGCATAGAADNHFALVLALLGLALGIARRRKLFSIGN